MSNRWESGDFEFYRITYRGDRTGNAVMREMRKEGWQCVSWNQDDWTAVMRRPKPVVVPGLPLEATETVGAPTDPKKLPKWKRWAWLFFVAGTLIAVGWSMAVTFGGVARAGRESQYETYFIQSRPDGGHGTLVRVYLNSGWEMVSDGPSGTMLRREHPHK